MTLTYLDLSWHVANNGNSSSGNATQSSGFVNVRLFVRIIYSLAYALAILSLLAISHTSNQGQGSLRTPLKGFLYRKTKDFPFFLFFKNIKASVCVAHSNTVIVIKVWKLLTSSTGSVFPSWLHCDALWSEQRLTFCSLQLNHLSLLTLTSIFLSCLSTRSSDLKGSSAHPAPSFQFLSVFNFISPLFACRDLLSSLCLCLAPPRSSHCLALHLPVADTWFTAC